MDSARIEIATLKHSTRHLAAITAALIMLAFAAVADAQPIDLNNVPPEILQLVPPPPPETPAETATFDGVPHSVPGGPVETALFYLFGGTLLVSALGVCISKSVVRMATFLFFALGAVAVLYLLLGATFRAAIQLIVYAGGTLILLVFGVMLTSKSPWVRYDCRPVELLAAAGVAGVLLVALVTVLLSTTWPGQAETAYGTTIAEFGKALLTTYLVPFEVASVLLLVVMIGAAYLARQEQ